MKTLDKNAEAVIAKILPQMPDGKNWNQGESTFAAWLLACDILPIEWPTGEDDKDTAKLKANLKAEFLTAVTEVVNPSACAQMLKSLPKEHRCYRARIERTAKLSGYE